MKEQIGYITKKYAEKVSPSTYTRVVIPLDSAHTDEELIVYGDTVAVVYCDAANPVNVRLGDKNRAAIDLRLHRRFEFYPLFDRIYYSNTAEAGKQVILTIGKDFKCDPITGFKLLDPDGVDVDPANETTATAILAKLTTMDVDTGNTATLLGVGTSTFETYTFTADAAVALSTMIGADHNYIWLDVMVNLAAGNAACIGDSGVAVTDELIAAGAGVELKFIKASEVYLINAVAGNNAKIHIKGVYH